jgi:hypothetical protein
MNLLMLLLAFQTSAELVGTDSKLEFENAWTRVVRVRYTPFQKTLMHDHPAAPTVYVYTTDGGRLRITHSEYEQPTIRPPVKAGAIRYQKAEAEHHTVEEMDGVPSEYLRVELTIEPLDPPLQDVRRAAGDGMPYESRMLRIVRVVCAPHSKCPASEHPGDPAVVVMGRDFQWRDVYAPPLMNSSDQPVEQVRIELIAKPVKSR